jgi:hypothetical protein
METVGLERFTGFRKARVYSQRTVHERTAESEAVEDEIIFFKSYVVFPNPGGSLCLGG